MEIRVLGIFSLLLVLVSVIFLIWGYQAVKAIKFPLIFLIFMVPLWFIQDIAFNLQYLSVQWAAWITQIIGLPIVTSGDEIHLGNIVFTVGIVCSGINTLVALLALLAVYTYLLKGAFFKRFGLFVFAIPVAIIANVLRITSIIIIAYLVDVNTATGWYHDISSPLFFFIAFIILILFGQLLKLKLNFDMFRKEDGKRTPANPG